MVHWKRIERVYCKVFKVSWWERKFGRAVLRLADAYYNEIDVYKLLKVLEQDKTDQMVYSRDESGNPLEWFDCDDFTFALMGAFHKNYDTASYPIFITWVSNIQHALISFYYDGEIFVIEPQTDEIYWLPEGEWKLSLLCG